MKILFAHLLNNYTGSPKVLSNILLSLTDDSMFELDLVTSSSNGCLTNLPNVNYINNYYKWAKNKIVQIGFFAYSQFYQFIRFLFGKRYEIYYINTVLPMGVALAAFVLKRRIIYHIHEVYTKPSLMHKLCIYVMKKTASHVVVVSQYMYNFYKTFLNCQISVVNNCVSYEFSLGSRNFLKERNIIKEKFNNKLIIMPTGLKKYKGIDVFVSLAKILSSYNFLLILSCKEDEAKKYFRKKVLPHNISFLYQIDNIIPYYQKASVVVNLTLPDMIMETFGMTLIEGFEFATPCIASNAGGPQEIIISGYNGFLVNPYEINDVAQKISVLLEDYDLYNSFAKNAFSSSKKYETDFLIIQIKNILNN